MTEPTNPTPPKGPDDEPDPTRDAFMALVEARLAHAVAVAAAQATPEHKAVLAAHEVVQKAEDDLKLKLPKHPSGTWLSFAGFEARWAPITSRTFDLAVVENKLRTLVPEGELVDKLIAQVTQTTVPVGALVEATEQAVREGLIADDVAEAVLATASEATTYGWKFQPVAKARGGKGVKA